MRDSNAYVSRAKRTRCYAETATFPRANVLVWSMVIGYLRSKTFAHGTWQFPHSNAYVSHEKHTRSNHACSSSIRKRSIMLLNWCDIDVSDYNVCNAYNFHYK